MSQNEFNDPSCSYKPEDAVLTPYQRAQQEWDERIGSARVQAKNWRLVALLLIGVVVILAAGLIYQSAKSTVTPYVVEVGSDGLVQAVGPAVRSNYTPTRAVFNFFLGQFVTFVRSLPLDPVVAKNQWLSAYAYLRQGAANTLNEIALKEKPFEKIGQETVSVQIKNVVPLSPDSYQVRWQEITYSKEGVSNGNRNMTGLFTVEVLPPTDEKRLKANPLGLYIKQFSWAQEF
jgi:type IV secretion system protein TrbF